MYVWVLGTGESPKDWRSAERLMAGLFLYGVGDRREGEEICTKSVEKHVVLAQSWFKGKG